MNRSLPALRRFGQNFLTDPNIRRKMVAALDIDPQDAVLEIGPGDGALTRPLMERARRVVAVEIDRGRCARLKESLPRSSRVRLICRDILETDIRGIASGCRRKRLIVFGNIPYNITSPLLVHLSGAAASIKAAYLTVQKEVAERLRAQPGSKAYGALTCLVRYHFDVRALFDVRPGSFTPAPKVTSSFIRLVPRDPAPAKGTRATRLFRIIRAGFGQRRKKLGAALKPFLPRGVSAGPELASYLARRAEDMSLEDFARLADLVFDNR